MIIGLSGKAGSGKTTFAKVAEILGFTRLSFADGVKHEVKEFLTEYEIPFDDRNLWGSQVDKEEVIQHFSPGLYALPGGEHYYTPKFLATFRELLQFWGTDFRRKQDPDYWVKRLLSQMVPGEKYVIDDLRFPDEAEAIRKRGGKVIRVERPHTFKISGPNHASEIALDNYAFDLTIENDDSLAAYIGTCALCFTQYQTNQELHDGDELDKYFRDRKNTVFCKHDKESDL